MVNRELAALARAIGEATKRGNARQLYEVGQAFASHGAAGDVVLALIAEGRRKKRRDSDLIGYLKLFSAVLETLRIDGNEGIAHARQQLRDLETLTAREVAAANLDPGLVMLIARAFVDAQIEPPPGLQDAMVEALQAAENLSPANAVDDLTDDMAAVAAELGHDPFAIYEELAASAAAFPDQHRISMVVGIATCAEPAIRAAAIGFLLDRDARMAEAVGSALAADRAAIPPDSATVERVARLRPWLPPERQPGVDAVLKALRRTARPPKPRAKAELVRTLATGIDGAGAQFLLAVAKVARKHAIISILVKEEDGICDVWTQPSSTKAESERMLGQAASEGGAIPVSRAYFERRLADALAQNRATRPPPFALVEALEAIDAGTIAPQAADVGTLLEEMLADLPPERTDAAAAAAAHRASRSWHEHGDAIESWFEADDEVDALLRPLRTKKQRVAAVVEVLLPRRRTRWAWRCAWTALALKDAADDEDLFSSSLWVEMALVGRDLAGDVPLARIPLMSKIAEYTVEAFMNR
jgi:hypothetical protein